MKTLHLQIIATLLCLICGILANLYQLKVELEGVRLVLINVVGMGCLPLALYMAYVAYLEYKSSVLE